MALARNNINPRFTTRYGPDFRIYHVGPVNRQAAYFTEQAEASSRPGALDMRGGLIAIAVGLAADDFGKGHD